MIQNPDVSIDEISSYYDELDSFYRELWGTHLHHGLWDERSDSKLKAEENLLREVLSYLDPLQDKDLVDIGCGYGSTAKRAIDLGAHRLTGITVSEKQFDFARTHLGNYPIDYQLSSWIDSDFPNDSFDGGYSIEYFDRVQDKKKFLEEVRRTIKPGGKFVMSCWVTSPKPLKWERKYFIEPICLKTKTPSLLNEEEMVQLIEEVNFQFYDYVDLTDKVWRTWLTNSRELRDVLKNKEGARYFFKRQAEHTFAMTVMRILAAYKRGCLKYGLFVMSKPIHQ